MLIDPSIELVLKLGHFLGVPLNFCLELLNLGILLLQSLRDAVLPVLQIGDNGLLIHDLFMVFLELKGEVGVAGPEVSGFQPQSLQNLLVLVIFVLDLLDMFLVLFAGQFEPFAFLPEYLIEAPKPLYFLGKQGQLFLVLLIGFQNLLLFLL